MRLSKTAYYADFGIYALLATATILWGLTWLECSMQLKALVALVMGCAAWTLVEYAVHRFVFHGVSQIAALHALHHAEPRAYIGTPTWLSAAVIAGFVFVPTWLILSLPIAAGFSTGFVLGFLWYGVAHHLIHHRTTRSAPVLQEAANRHHRHHGSSGLENFGLTTAFWDRLFNTRSEIGTARYAAVVSPKIKVAPQRSSDNTAGAPPERTPR